MFSRNRTSSNRGQAKNGARRKGQKKGYGRKLGLESLEDRRVLTLVGVAPVDFPIIGYDSGGSVAYDSANDSFAVSATPLTINTGSSSGFFFTGNLDINIEVDDSGGLVGGVLGDDLLLTGTVDVDGDFVVDYAGILLTGEILEFGFEDSGGTTDLYDFRFVVTGGQLASYFAGKDIGVTTSSENSSFTGDFSVDFGGNAKGELGSIERPEEPAIDLEKFVTIMRKDDCPPEGLTPGFWKNHSHYGHAPHEAWSATGYDPDDSYEAIFSVNVAPGDVTLLEALNSQGGGVKALMRHSAAALLNAAHPNINYAYSASEVIDLTREAINSGSPSQIEHLKNEFDHQNNKGADLSDCHTCEPKMIGPKDADNAPGLFAKVGDKVMYSYTITNTGDVALNIDSFSDDNGTPGNPADDFMPTAVDADFNGFNDGDTNNNGVLDPGETWQFQTGFATITEPGEVCNIAVVTASSVNTGAQVMDEDSACYTAIKDHRHKDKCDGRDEHDRDKDRCDDRDKHGKDRDKHGRDKHEHDKHDRDKHDRDKHDRDKHDRDKHDRDKHDRDKHDRDKHDRDKHDRDKHDDKGKDKHDWHRLLDKVFDHWFR